MARVVPVRHERSDRRSRGGRARRGDRTTSPIYGRSRELRGAAERWRRVSAGGRPVRGGARPCGTSVIPSSRYFFCTPRGAMTLATSVSAHEEVRGRSGASRPRRLGAVGRLCCRQMSSVTIPCTVEYIGLKGEGGVSPRPSPRSLVSPMAPVLTASQDGRRRLPRQRVPPGAAPSFSPLDVAPWPSDPCAFVRSYRGTAF